MKHTKIYHITARFLLAATLLAVSWTSATAAETAVPYAHIENDELVFYYDGNITDTDWAIVGFQNPESRGWHESASSIAGVRFDDSFKSYAPTVASYWFYGMSQVQTIDLSEIDMSQLTEADGMFQNCTRLTTIYVNESWPAAEATVTPGGSTSSVTGVDMFNGCRSLVGGSNTAYDGQYTGYSYAHIDGGVDYPGYFTYKNAQVSTLEIYSISKSVTYTANQPITPTQSVTMTPGNDSEWKTDLAIGLTDTTTGESNDPLEFKASIYYPNSTETFSFLDALRGTLNPKDGDLTTNSETGEVTNSGKVYNPSDKNLPKSGAYIIYEALQNGSLIIPIRVTADKSLFVVTADGSLVLDMQFKDAAGTTQVFKTDPLCSVSSEYISGFISLNVEAGQKYYVFCNASRPRIAGYIFSPDPITIDPATMADVKSVLNTEPYAVLDGTTLYFYYDDQKSARGGMDIGPFASSSDRGWDGYVENIKSVEFDQSFSNCTSITSTALWFVNCYQLETITNLNYLNTENVTSMKEMFSDCSGLTSLDVSNFNTGKVTDMYHLFSNCQQVTSLDVKDFNTANVTNMGHMFAGCSELTSLDVRNFNTSNVTDMEQMFYNCSKVTNLDLSNFNTSNVTTMYQMFVNCSGLTRLDLGKFNTSNVTNMGEMFTGCSGLTYLNLSSFNTSQVTYMGGMFNNCSSLTSLDVSNFNTSNVTNMFGLFLGCKQLTTLDLSNFETTKTTDMSVMFASASQLKTIYVGSGWNVSNVRLSDNMFLNCASLVGGAGTVFDENHVDHTYARIDGGTSAPGYFTEKNAANPSTDEHNLYPAKNIVWDDITWKNAHNSRDKDNNYMPFLMGSGLGYKTLLAESFYSEEQGANITRPYYTYVDYEAGETGVPGYGLYYRFTPKTSGQLRFNTWVNKGNRKTFVVKGSTGAALEPYVDYTFDGYVNGQNNITDGVSYPIYFTADEIKARHDESGTVNKYVVDKGNQIFWGWITLNVEAGESYYIYQQTSQLGFGGYDFIPTGGTAESYVSCIRSTTDDTFALSSEFAAVVDENGKATNVTERGSFVRFGTTNMDVEALGSSTPISVEAGLDIQPYAVLSDNNTVLTFYYDDQKSARGGMDIGPFAYLEHGFGESQRPWHDVRESIVYAVIDPSMSQYTSLVSTGWWFYGCKNLKSVSGWENLYPLNIVDMWGTFEYCSSLPSDPAAGGPDFSDFKSTSLKRTVCMFHGCTSMTSLDLSSLNTANVTENEAMFNGCTALTTIYVGSGWDMSNATDNWIDNMFSGCTSLVGGAGTRYDANNIGTSYAHIDGGVDNPGYLTELIRKPLTAADYFEWTGMKANATKKSESPYPNCYYILGQSAEIPYGEPDVNPYTYADVSMYDRLEVTATGNTPRILLNRDSVGGQWNEDESLSHMIESTQRGWSSKYFSHSGNVWTVDLKQIVADKGFAHLNAIKGNNWSTVTITKMELVKGIVESTSAEPYAVLSDNNTVLTFRYDNQKAANNGADVGPFDYFSKDKRGWAPYTSQITKAVFDPSFDRCTSLTSTAFWFTFMDHLETIENIQYLHTDNVENMDCMFDSCYVLRDLDVSHFVTSKVKNMQCMFNRCELLTSLDLRNFDTSSCEFMRGMFYDCKGLTSLNITSFDTSKNTSTESMFQFCSSLTMLDLSHFSTESVTDMSYMFGNCEKLTSLDLSSFNTSRVTEMECMFNQCTSLTNINFGQNFNTENVTKMSLMFSGCTGLTSLDVSRFNTQNVTEMTAMFQRCSGLTDLDLSSFNTERVSMMGWVFNYCSSLRSLNISGFSTANVTDIVNMFKECSSLASIQAGNAAIPDSIYAQIGNPNLLLYVNEASLAPSNVQNVVVNGAAENIVLTDAEGNNNFYCPQEFTARRISYTHNYQQATEIGVSRGWETIALPFTVQTITHEKNGPLAPFGVDGGKPFWLKQLTDNGLISAQRIEANVPYLISMPNNGRYPADYNQAGNVTFSATNVVVPMTEQREMSGNNRTLRPTTMRVAQSPSVYAINRNAAYESNPEGSIFVADYREVRPFEAYVEHPNGARFISLDELMEGTTGIETIEQPQWSGAEQWWSIDGRKLNGKPSQKGVYIRNGKKVVVKATF